MKPRLRLKVLVKRINIAVCSLFVFLTLSVPNVLAENNSDQSGKLRLKSERISEDQTKKKEQQDYKETELEKKAPGLFKEQNRAAIQTKQKEHEKLTEEMKQWLFVSKNHENTTVKDITHELFTEEYEIENLAFANQIDPKQVKEDGMDSKTLVSLVLFVLVLCSGMYFIMRRMLG